MKKILAFTIIAVLASCMIFAATKYTGSATIAFDYNLDNTDYGFANSTSQKLTWAYEFEAGTGSSTGSGDLYAEIAGKFSVDIKSKGYTATGATNAISVNTLKITKANIVVKDDLVIGILGPGSGADYVESYYDNDGDDEADYNTIGALTTEAGGFNLSYKGFTGGFALKGNVDAKTNETFAWVETKSFEVADGATAQAAAAILAKDGDINEIDANAKASYATDKFTADAAVDFATDLDNFEIEASATASIAPVKVDAYVATDFEDAILAAKAAVDFAVEEVSATAYVDVQDILKVVDMRVAAGIEASYDVISCDAEVAYFIDAEELSVEANIEYAPEAFTVAAGLEMAFAAGENTSIAPTASIASTKVIDNATVKAEWTGAELSENATKANGKITLSAKVSF